MSTIVVSRGFGGSEENSVDLQNFYGRRLRFWVRDAVLIQHKFTHSKLDIRVEVLDAEKFPSTSCSSPTSKP